MTTAARHNDDGGGVFRSAAVSLSARGLAVIPLGRNDGKAPSVSRFDRWRRPPGRKAVKRMAAQFPHANIGILCGLSGLTVIDVDGDAALANEARKRFGTPPVEVATPSGGRHLYFRNGGERCANLRREGLSIDIKANGGLIVAPPSRKFSTGAEYAFVRGGWDDLTRLPTILQGALDRPQADLPRGMRNDGLFREALRQARHCDDADALLDVMETRNAGLTEPMDQARLERAVASAWRYEAEGKNWVGGEARPVMDRTKWMALASVGTDAAMLYQLFQMEHAARIERGETFAIIPEAMAAAECIPGWGKKRYRQARDALLEAGFLVRLFASVGRMPSQYALAH